jgi:ectoine hydroxylase-related dioxygenase (phytanoyl-CoA dioxygenase family)
VAGEARDGSENGVNAGARHALGELIENIEQEGWFATPPVVAQSELDALVNALEPLQRASGERGGLRNLFEVPSVRSLAQSAPVRSIAEAVLGEGCVAVKATLFDKTPSANWKVVWHQDVTIAVRERYAVPGFETWTEKRGTPHVQPPASVLERMLAVRVHLDDCRAQNGPVCVIPRSHRAGRLSAEAIGAWRERASAVSCEVERGGILAFHPLLLHASSAAASPAHRRVLHFEFAADGILPPVLDWAEAV